MNVYNKATNGPPLIEWGVAAQASAGQVESGDQCKTGESTTGTNHLQSPGKTTEGSYAQCEHQPGSKKQKRFGFQFDSGPAKGQSGLGTNGNEVTQTTRNAKCCQNQNQLDEGLRESETRKY